jgi:hypothetical protein
MRAVQVQIAISRLRMSNADIAAAIRSGAEDAFSAEQLSAILAILPSAEDADTCLNFDGPTDSLGKAEQFFQAVASVPKYMAHTKCMHVRSTVSALGQVVDQHGLSLTSAKL